MALSDRISATLTKFTDALVEMAGGILGGVAVWLVLFCLFYFDTWSRKLFYSAVVLLAIYLIAKVIDRLHQGKKRSD